MVRARSRGAASPPASRPRRHPRAVASGADRRALPPSPLSLNRISVYLRALRRLQARAVESVSSFELAHLLHLSAAQIRKDLAQFGAFGVRGVGYRVATLAERLHALLGLDREQRLVVVGLGHLGTAIVRSAAFNSGGFRCVAGFDTDPAKIGRAVGNLLVRDVDELEGIVRESETRLGALCVPAEAAAASYDSMCAAGLQGVLNFTAARLQPRPGVLVKNVDLTIFLEELAYFVQRETARTTRAVATRSPQATRRAR